MALEVELQAYDGPLDLLLGLIEKNKINIFDIPIVEITDQYLAYVRQMGTEDLDVMSEFMVMAAELIAIKCRMLLPKDEAEEEESDPREELVRRLLEYKTCKYLAGELKGRMPGAEQHFYREDSTPAEVRAYRPKADPKELLSGITMEQLHALYRSILRRQSDKIDPVRSSFGTIEMEEVSLPDTLDKAADYIERHGSCSFSDLVKGRDTKMQIVVSFISVLELMRYGYISASQSGPWADLVLTRNRDVSLLDVKKHFSEDGFGREDTEDGQERSEDSAYGDERYKKSVAEGERFENRED